MNNPIVAELESYKWAMEPSALKAFMERAAAMPANSVLPSIIIAQQPRVLQVKDGIGIIAISGVLLKTVPGWVRFLGIEATGYDEIQSQLAEALANKAVKQIHLQVDSPGGQVAGEVEASDAIFNAREHKPVTAAIEDVGASGAYWLTSQAETIEVNRNTMVGSIGIYSVHMDYSEMAAKVGIKIVVIRSGEYKGMGIDKITDTQVEGVQQIIDAMAENFIEAIARGRGHDIEDIRELATGQLWIAATARELGLIDAVIDSRQQETADSARGITGKNLNAPRSTLNANQNTDITGDSVMKTEEEKNQEAALAEQLQEASRAATETERIRMSQLKTEFADDPEFAMQAFTDGLTVAEAKAKYCDVLRDRLAAKNAEAATGTEREQASGVPPLANEDTDEGAGGDFIAEAKEMAAEKKITVTAAMQKLARQRPGLHESFKGQCRDHGSRMYREAV